MNRGGGGYAAPMGRRVKEGSGPNDGFKFRQNRPVSCIVMGVGISSLGGGSLMKSFVRCRIFGEGVSSVRTPAQKCYSRM